MPLPSDILPRLMAVIAERKASMPPGSYTTTLFAGGVEKIGAKVTEEAGEVAAAAAEPGDAGRQHLVYEATDLVYHLCVMLVHRGVGLEDVEGELARRFGMSGLDEKASRPPNPTGLA